MSAYLPVLGYSLFLIVAIGWRSWLQYRRFGHSGIVLFRSASPVQIVRESLFAVALALPLVQAVIVVLDPSVLEPIAYAAMPVSGWRLLPGCLLLFGGTFLVVKAQLHLGKSWRIGIEEGARPGLITGGLYRFCRNPIYLAMFAVFAGMAVLIPTAVSLFVLVGAWLGVRTQVIEEEAYLLRTYGDEFRVFSRRVGRFVPGLGLLR